MTTIMTTTETTEFWDRLRRLRAASRLVLAALERDDVEEVERLARESDRDMSEIRPWIEARVAAARAGEEDAGLMTMLQGLKDANDQILAALAERREDCARKIGVLRENRLRLTHYRPAGDGAQVLDRVR